MTGKEKRVLSGYHALRAAAPRFEHEPRRQCHYFAAPQLVHNLMLMVDCCEQVIEIFVVMVKQNTYVCTLITNIPLSTGVRRIRDKLVSANSTLFSETK